MVAAREGDAPGDFYASVVGQVGCDYDGGEGGREVARLK